MSKLILLNKPYNVLSQFTDKENRATLADYIDSSGVYPAGRLDYDSEGLILLTDDGTIQHQISHPNKKMVKTYWVQVEGEPTEQQLEPLRQGITLNDGPCKPAQVKRIAPPDIWQRQPPIRSRGNTPTRWLEIRISEGRNRQVRRMTAAIGFPTLRLIRVSVGHWALENLLPGESKTLRLHSPQKTSKSRHPSAGKGKSSGKGNRAGRKQRL
jgi:23S rRNA pseudouridine2457 synthase